MPDKLQNKSDRYWLSAQTTYLASPEYYDLQERELRRILAEIGPVSSLADVGCGDGRYTLVALEMAERAYGFDISPTLIGKAKLRNEMHPQMERATFSVGSFEEIASGGPYDVVLCLGVLSAVIDADRYRSALTALHRATKPNGFLVTKETLTLGDESSSSQGDYVALYRNLESYIWAIRDLGFSLRSDVELVRATGQTRNAIYVFRRDGNTIS